MPDQIKASGNPLANYFRQPKLYIRLPSQGKYYPDGSLDVSQIEEYPVYAMTAKDELMFKTPDALMNGQATVEVIKSCVPAIKDPWQVPSIDMDTILIAIRIATYGDTMEVSSSCPSCGHDNDYVMNLVNFLDNAQSFEYQSRLEIGPLVVNLKPYSYKDITKTAIKTLEQQKILSVVTDNSLSEEEKVERFGESFVKLTELTVNVVTGCIDSIETPEGAVSEKKFIEEFIANAPAEVFNAINDHIASMKESMTLSVQNVHCGECNYEFNIDVTMDQTNFFGKGS